MRPRSDDGFAGRRRSRAACRDRQDCADRRLGVSLAAWVSGAVQFGTVTPDGLIASNKFTTAGLTAGVDWRTTDNLIVGVGGRLSAPTRPTSGTNGTRSDATSFSGMVYGSYKPFDRGSSTRASVMAALATTTAAGRRRQHTVTGNRKGSYWFGAVTASYEIKYDALRLAPYVRADFMSASLDAYAEQGSSAELLTYGAMNFNSVAGAVGLRGSYDIPMSWGVLTPTARAEYRQALDGAFQQSMYYTDLGAGHDLDGLRQDCGDPAAWSTPALGLRARSLGGMSGELEYGTSDAPCGKAAIADRSARP